MSLSWKTHSRSEPRWARWPQRVDFPEPHRHSPPTRTASRRIVARSSTWTAVPRSSHEYSVVRVMLLPAVRPLMQSRPEDSAPDCRPSWNRCARVARDRRRSRWSQCSIGHGDIVVMVAHPHEDVDTPPARWIDVGPNPGPTADRLPLDAHRPVSRFPSQRFHLSSTPPRRVESPAQCVLRCTVGSTACSRSVVRHNDLFGAPGHYRRSGADHS